MRLLYDSAKRWSIGDECDSGPKAPGSECRVSAERDLAFFETPESELDIIPR